MSQRLDPVRIQAPGDKVIEELVGKVATSHNNYSVAHMTAPAGWEEPAQRPAFDEVTFVIAGQVLVEHDGRTERLEAGESFLSRAGDEVRYLAGPEGAEYLAVCVPAFTEEGARRAD